MKKKKKFKTGNRKGIKKCHVIKSLPGGDFKRLGILCLINLNFLTKKKKESIKKEMRSKKKNYKKKKLIYQPLVYQPLLPNYE